MSYPIIPWMDGKRHLADHLIPLFPPPTNATSKSLPAVPRST